MDIPVIGACGVWLAVGMASLAAGWHARRERTRLDTHFAVTARRAYTLSLLFDPVAVDLEVSAMLADLGS